LLNRRQRFGTVVHDVIPGITVNVKIHVTRGYDAIAKIRNGNSGRRFPAAPIENCDDASVLNEHNRMLDSVSRSEQSSSSESQHRNVLIEAKTTTYG
jgi:hypothetical protein